jgi:hypothetical protein
LPNSGGLKLAGGHLAAALVALELVGEFLAFVDRAEMWTNTSWPPASGWMKPKPLVALNHFTVPVAMDIAFRIQVFAQPRRDA